MIPNWSYVIVSQGILMWCAMTSFVGFATYDARSSSGKGMIPRLTSAWSSMSRDSSSRSVPSSPSVDSVDDRGHAGRVLTMSSNDDDGVNKYIDLDQFCRQWITFWLLYAGLSSVWVATDMLDFIVPFCTFVACARASTRSLTYGSRRFLFILTSTRFSVRRRSLRLRDQNPRSPPWRTLRRRENVIYANRKSCEQNGQYCRLYEIQVGVRTDGSTAAIAQCIVYGREEVKMRRAAPSPRVN